MEDILFSIVIPVYNSGKYLERCIDSILAQTYPIFELFLVDDGSIDVSAKICDEYARNDCRVKAFHKENGGSNSARNIGIDAAAGDYICLVDSDDYVEKDYLNDIQKAIKDAPVSPDLVIIKARYTGHGFGNTELTGFYDINRLNKEVFPYAIERNINKWEGPIISHVPWDKVYKANLLKEHCCRDYRIKVSNDAAFAFECVYSAGSLAVLDKEIYVHDDTSTNSLQRSYHSDLIQNYSILFRYLDQRLIRLNESIPAQLSVHKAMVLRIAIQKYYTFAPSLLTAKKDLKRGIEESNILDMVQPQNMPFMQRMRVWLLRNHLYLACLVLQKVMDKVKGNELVK